ncbi:MAG: Two-component transcriptional response regulator, OmpR family [Ktedonobacterales bacterium]|jgi:DNA-binding response OmpR family regulator|nr:MAG: Two-component transcriptional response regulator, OmpR family [Ktedonobacterales bacterium]
MKILVVDDDLELLGLIGFALRSAGYFVVEAQDGTRALEVFEREQPDLVILDVNLPGMNGFEVCKRIRAQDTTPVLMLTVRNAEEDHVAGLDQGADDYLTKPFSPRTLLAHLRALHRRAGFEHPATLAAGDLRLNPEDQSIFVNSTAIHLTNREFRLLHYLMANAGHTVSVERLTTHVWGYESAGDRQLLKQIVHRLRQKIERDPTDPRYLLTVSGVGYVLRPAPPPAAPNGEGRTENEPQ